MYKPKTINNMNFVFDTTKDQTMRLCIINHPQKKQK